MFSFASYLKVIDLSTVLAGPSVGMFFAEIGADVIKIENPKTGGDVTRTWKNSKEAKDAAVSAYWSSINFGKKYVSLNIADAADRSVLDTMLIDADILITNFKAGDDTKFGLDFNSLHGRFPHLILASISGFDSTPERVAYDVVLQAETGFMYMNGTPGGPSVKMPVALMDVLAAHQLKEAVLCAILERHKTGKGCAVNCSLEKAGIASLINQASNYLMSGVVAEKMGTLHPNIAPYGESFICADGKEMVLAVGSDKQFQSLLRMLGLEEMISDARFKDNPSRLANRTALQEALAPAFQQRNAEELLTIFIRENIPSGIVRSIDEVLSREPSLSMIRQEAIEHVNTKRISSIAFEVIMPEV
jgi:crotonobetainyl-CoA:carnitine CoA-transferase CaiB-like acyl-CoA transferase